jgi:hypothetical protein
MMTDLPAYAGGLLTMLVVVGFTAHRFTNERWQLARVALAIFLNWLAGASYVIATENYTPWHFSIFIDALAAFAVMWQPAGRVQGFIGLFYLLQIAGHTAFGVRRLFGLGADPLYYYDAITFVAWAQLLAMGVWSGGLWGRSLFRRLRDRRDEAGRRAGVFGFWRGE